MSNPLIYLFAQLWRYSEGNRRVVVLYSLLFVIAGATSLLGFPWVWSKIIDIVQKEGITPASLHELMMLLGVLVGIQVVFWAVHGPARVLENVNAFKVRGQLSPLPAEGHHDPADGMAHFAPLGRYRGQSGEGNAGAL